MWRGHPHGNGTASTQTDADDPVLPQLRRRLQGSASEEFEVRNLHCGSDAPCRVPTMRMLPRVSSLHRQDALACGTC